VSLSSIQPSSGMVPLWDYTIIIYHRVLKKAKPPISPRVCCSKAMQPESSPQPASWKHLTIHRVVKQRQRSCLVTFLTACFKGLPGTNTSCLWTQLERKHHIICRILFEFFASVFFCFLSRYHLPCIGNSFKGYLLHFGMVTLHFAWYLLHLAMFAFHFAWYFVTFWHFNLSFAWYLLRFGTSNVHVGLLGVL